LAGLATGLRPKEWLHAQYDPKRNQLTVRNAKATNSRSHGETRILHLENFDEQLQQILQYHLQHVASYKDNFDAFAKFYDRCRSAIYEANKKLWPRRKTKISLYSARHQFVEDAKKAGVSLEELAAILGHASIETATFHYGRKAAGKPGNFKVTANSADLERVKNSNLHREQGHKNHPTLLH
jgi:integrase